MFGTEITIMHPLMELLGKLAEIPISGCSVGVPGTTSPGIAAPGGASGTIGTSGTTSTSAGSGWLFLCFLRQDSSIPLLFYPLTLLRAVARRKKFFSGS